MSVALELQRQFQVWQKTQSGIDCHNVLSLPTDGAYVDGACLENRLWRAFMAGSLATISRATPAEKE